LKAAAPRNDFDTIGCLSILKLLVVVHACHKEVEEAMHGFNAQTYRLAF